jgi:hypothetical protein
MQKINDFCLINYTKSQLINEIKQGLKKSPNLQEHQPALEFILTDQGYS